NRPCCRQPPGQQCTDPARFNRCQYSNLHGTRGYRHWCRWKRWRSAYTSRMVRHNRKGACAGTNSSDPALPGRCAQMIARIAVLISTFLLVTVVIPQTNSALPKADSIYIHGNIYTGVAGASSFHEGERAKALAVRGDRILAVGEEVDVLKSKGPDTTIID